jgi:HD-GYP domain-containing protein (c-di-GMP phosphodiesterase class II)
LLTVNPNAALMGMQKLLSICSKDRFELLQENYRLEDRVEQGDRDLATSQDEVQAGADGKQILQDENRRLEDLIETGTRSLTASQDQVQKGIDHGLLLEKLNQELEVDVLLGIETLRGAYIKSLNRLALAAEYRDDDTGQHVQRVGRNAALLATALGLSDEQAGLIRLAAPLHDVGKIGIADAILLKPGKLSSDEFCLMTTHSLIGAKILSGSESPIIQLAEQIALTHHECWDGSGYPNGTKGEAIHLAGRIVSLADVFDALTHPRSYKKAWSPEESAAEIVRLTGSKFDPRIVVQFLRLFREGSFGVE